MFLDQHATSYRLLFKSEDVQATLHTLRDGTQLVLKVTSADRADFEWVQVRTTPYHCVLATLACCGGRVASSFFFHTSQICSSSSTTPHYTRRGRSHRVQANVAAPCQPMRLSHHTSPGRHIPLWPHLSHTHLHPPSALPCILSTADSVSHLSCSCHTPVILLHSWQTK